MKYKGSFVNGLEEGKGVLIDKEGHRHEGTFKGGKRDGDFIEYDVDGKVVKKTRYKNGFLQSTFN